jgi:hypothetical protein
VGRLLMLLESPEIRLSETPDRIVMVIPGLNSSRARHLANTAVAEARRKSPKASGNSAKRLQPLYGKNFFGIYFPDSYVFFQDHGIRPFTMKNLAGKTIPMWVNDPTGALRLKNPKAKVKTDAAGKVKVLIFRKAAMQGARIQKYKRDPKTGQRVLVSDAPASYPGAPGRIATRETGSPYTTGGRVAGAIARGNVGVRWRHPGIAPRLFLNNAVTLAAQWNGILPVRVYLADRSTRPQALING